MCHTRSRPAVRRSASSAWLRVRMHGLASSQRCILEPAGKSATHTCAACRASLKVGAMLDHGAQKGPCVRSVTLSRPRLHQSTVPSYMTTRR
jgi:hypothetical protein